MQKSLTPLTACALLAFSTLFMTADNAHAEEAKKPESLTERISYAYGLMISRQLKERGIEIDLGQFSNAFKSVVDGKEPLLSEDEVAAAFAENQKITDAKNMSPEDKVNMEAGQAFLTENGKKEGVKTTASGLQYEVMKAGDGAKPKATDEVTVHYHGTLIDGTVFDSSVQRGEPATFPLNRVIPGWTEGVQLMPKGAKYKFFIPYDLAYAERGAGADIKPFSALVFEVELLEIAGAE
jgi:FKBP-type peptidyl-prolyl cis-trans isomerase FklB